MFFFLRPGAPCDIQIEKIQAWTADITLYRRHFGAQFLKKKIKSILQEVTKTSLNAKRIFSDSISTFRSTQISYFD